MKRLALLAPLFFVSSASLACGSLDTKTDTSPPLVTIDGQIVNPTSMASTGAVRVAVIWRNRDASENNFNEAEDLPVQPVFPSSFSIQLTNPPPASAFQDGADFLSPDPTESSAPAMGREPRPAWERAQERRPPKTER